MIAYISGRHQLFLFGGFTTNDRVADTWIYDFESSIWTELQPRNQPSPRSDSCMAYDPENDVVVLYSGYLLDDSNTQDTWIYSFEEENWILKDPDNPPLGQYGHYMVYADSLGQLLMYPGHWSIYSNSVMVSHGFGGNIWEYDVVEDMWTERFSDSIPPGRYWGNLVYDSTENRLILFGGHGATDYDDTWVYNLEEKTWDKAIQNMKPSKRGSIGMAYDPVNHAVVLFGGYNENGQSLGDTWILDCETLTWYQPENTSNTVPEDDTSSFSIPGFPLLASFLAITLISLLKKTSLIE